LCGYQLWLHANSPATKEQSAINADLKTELLRIGNDAKTPLRTATSHGGLEMRRFLVCEGKIDPLSALRWDDDGQLVLIEETRKHQENMPAILQLLRRQTEIASRSRKP
jgi:hypothetical protein